MDIHALLRGFAAELTAVEVEPALGAVEVDGVDYGSYACGLAVVVAQQLAQESGYHSYSTFSSAFRQRMHKNVTDWMREEVFLQM